MSVNLLRSRKVRKARLKQRSDSSAHGCTGLVQKGKRKNRDGGLPQGKRARREEVAERETEELQVLSTTADSEEGGWSSSETSCFFSNEDVSSEELNKSIESEPEETQSDQRESEDDRGHKDKVLRDVLDVKYIQEDCLGQGGYGSVYAGYRREDLLPVAIKHIPTEFVKRTTVDVNGEQRELPLEVVLLTMAGEAKAAPGETQPFAVALLDWYELPQELVIVMERPVPSMDLMNYIEARGGSLQEQEAKVILRQLVEAKISLLSKGVLHRDIKPNNILVHMEPEGLRIRILDFGVGSVLRDRPYTDLCGSIGYAPTEFCPQDSHQAEPSVMWQIGTVFYTMLHGERPFNNTWEMITKDPTLRDQLSEGCKDLLRSCLDKRARSRATLRDVLQHRWLQ